MTVMRAQIKTDAEALAVPMSDVRALLRASEDEIADTILAPHVQAATRYIENTLGYSFISKTYTLKLPFFVSGRDPFDDFWYEDVPRGARGLTRGGAYRAIECPITPLQTVVHIKYFDTSEVEQTWSAANYQIDTHSRPGRIAPATAATHWPSDVSIHTLNPIEIEFTAGFGDDADDVPFEIRQAVAMFATHLFENPEAREPEPHIWNLLTHYRTHSFR